MLGMIADQLRETPERSNRQIAAGLGVDDKTVGVTRAALEATAEIPQLERTVGADGKARPSKPLRTVFVDDTPGGQRAALDRAKVIRAAQASPGALLPSGPPRPTSSDARFWGYLGYPGGPKSRCTGFLATRFQPGSALTA